MTRRRSAQFSALFCVLSLAASCPLALGAAKKSPEWDTNINAGRQALTKGEFAEADRLLKSALDNTRFFKDDDKRMGVTLRSMGELYLRWQNWLLAKEYFERALAAEQKLSGPEALEVGDDLYGLAICTQQLGDHLLAEIYLKRVEEIWRKKLGLSNPRLLSILPAMGAYASMKNEFAQAESYYKQAIPLAEAQYGAGSPKVGSYLNLLALVQGNEAKYSEAKDNANRALALLKKDPQANIAIDSAQDNLRIVERKATAEVTGGGTGSSSSSTITAENNGGKPHVIASVPERKPEEVKPIEKPVKEIPPVKVSGREKPTEPVTHVTIKEKEPVAPVTTISIKEKEPEKPVAKPTTPVNVAVVPSVPGDTGHGGTAGPKPWETDKPVKRADAADKSQQWGKVRYLADGKLISAEQYKAMLLATEAYEMLQQEKYKMAADMLRKALDMYPELPSAHTNLGLVLSRMGQSDEAIDHLRTAIALDSSRSAPWVNLAGCFQNSGLLKDCVETYNEYLHRFPEDSLAFKAKDLVKHLQEELNEQQAVEREVASAGGTPKTDYFSYTTHDGTIKWTDKNMPLKVHVATAVKVPGYKPEFEGLFTDAFKQWCTASGDKIKLEYVAKPEAANIECVWTNDYSQVSSPSEGGEAQVSWSSDGIQHVKIVILTADPTPDSPLSQNQVRAVCLHEIGHSLGLMGHSPRADDIMYCTMPSAEVKPAISLRDSGTLRRLYSSDVMIALRPSGNHDGSDKNAINNEGVDLMQAKAYAKAVEKFEQALKLDPNYDVARENLTKACNNYALELVDKGNTQQAESVFQKALNVQAKIRNFAVKLTTIQNYAKLLRHLRRDKEADSLELEAKSLKGS